MLEWLRNTPIPLTQISKTTGISRNTLYSWLSGGSDIRDSNYQKVNKYYSTYYKKEKEGHQMDSSHIGLLQEKVERQSLEIGELKQVIKTKQVESTHWDNLQYDYLVHVKIIRNGFKIGRRIESIENAEALSKQIGYSMDEINEYFAVGVDYPDMDSHPINGIVCEETKKQLVSYTSSMPYILDTLKNMVGNHYIPMPVTYINKDGSKTHTICYNKVNWSEMTVDTKVALIVGSEK
jgi:hypothetical protein